MEASQHDASHYLFLVRHTAAVLNSQSEHTAVQRQVDLEVHLDLDAADLVLEEAAAVAADRSGLDSPAAAYSGWPTNQH